MQAVPAGVALNLKTCGGVRAVTGHGIANEAFTFGTQTSRAARNPRHWSPNQHNALRRARRPPPWLSGRPATRTTASTVTTPRHAAPPYEPKADVRVAGLMLKPVADESSTLSELPTPSPGSLASRSAVRQRLVGSAGSTQKRSLHGCAAGRGAARNCTASCEVAAARGEWNARGE